MKGDSSRNSSERKTPKIPVYADELPHFGLSKPVRGDIIPEIVPILNFITKKLSKIVPNYGRECYLRITGSSPALLKHASDTDILRQ